MGKGAMSLQPGIVWALKGTGRVVLLGSQVGGLFKEPVHQQQ